MIACNRDRKNGGGAASLGFFGFENHKRGGLEERKKVDREEEGL